MASFLWRFKNGFQRFGLEKSTKMIHVLCGSGKQRLRNDIQDRCPRIPLALVLPVRTPFLASDYPIFSSSFRRTRRCHLDASIACWKAKSIAGSMAEARENVSVRPLRQVTFTVWFDARKTCCIFPDPHACVLHAKCQKRSI